MSEQETTPQEIWKTIEECPLYSVSNFGRVRRDAKARGTRAGRMLKQSLSCNGYFGVDLRNFRSSGPKRLSRLVHRLVAQAFLDPDPTRPDVNHKDGKPTSNCAWNLEWVTAKENTVHAYRMFGIWNARGERTGNAKLSDCKVLEIKQRLLRGETHKSIAQLFDVARATITKINNEQIWSHVKLVTAATCLSEQQGGGGS